jgi:hypothetical protein
MTSSKSKSAAFTDLYNDHGSRYHEPSNLGNPIFLFCSQYPSNEIISCRRWKAY